MYIVFEGIVGAGKSTQTKRLTEYLESPWQQVVQVREPGSTPIAEDIRYLAQGKSWENEEMHPLTNAYLYAAARSQTLHTVVKPALKAGKTVIADRSLLSSLAYQGEAQGLGLNTVLSINSEAVKEILPDIILYMDLDIDTALSRTFDSRGDKWETMGKEFFEKISHGYEKCEKLDLLKNKIIRIDATGSEDEIFERIKHALVPQKYFNDLTTYDAYFGEENGIGNKFKKHVRSFGIKAFASDHWEVGHITGSIFITNETFDKVLLMHHKKLDKWLQFGGHCDGSFKVLDVSIREFQEESGIDRAPQIYCFDKEKDFCIFDLDIHDLPPDTKRNGPAHKHFDMRFLGIIPEDALINKCNEEVNEIKWFTLEEAQKHIQEESIQRMLKKLKNI